MKQVFLIPMSMDVKDNENKINEAIYKIGKDHSITWLTNLIKALDESKYMLIGEKDESDSAVGTDTPEIGVITLRGSQDMRKTEKEINEVLAEMEHNEQTFFSICRPAEYMYIILFEYKAGKNPRVKIMPNVSDPYSGSRCLSHIFDCLDEDEEWGLQPYDSFMIDDDNLLVLFSE